MNHLLFLFISYCLLYMIFQLSLETQLQCRLSNSIRNEIFFCQIHQLIFEQYSIQQLIQYIYMQPTQRFVSALEKISKRFSFILFSKLVLFDHTYEVYEGHIRHYDKQCEAVETLANTLNTKFKASKFRAFYLIKFFRKTSIPMTNPILQNRTFTQKNSTNSFYTIESRKQGKSFNTSFNFPNTTKHQDTRPVEDPEDNSEFLTDIDASMSNLANKIKSLNKIFQMKNEEDPQKADTLKKVYKRNVLMGKLNSLQNDISFMLDEDYNRTNLVSFSKMEIKYNPGNMRNYKTNRQVSQTLYTSNRHPY